MKLLSPAGNFESLKMAVYNGADEVYLGINDFNARNNIDGFTMDNLEDAIDFAHLFGVKVCLAINILFSDEQLSDAVDTVVKAFNLGVDAFIIQDLGLMNIINKHYPQITLHASTQMAIHNLEGVLFLKKFGVKRVVLARETPLEEIKRIKDNVDVEIEYFVQGALCVSFSGNCYLSSYLFNASGNKGKCKQPCRLPYTLEKDNKTIKTGYLLSAKDFNMSKKLTQLKDAGVDVLKIEGRARRPFYVATTTREYRNALNKKQPNQENLMLAFNRQYVSGYFDGNGKIISNLQNHIGINVGRVEKVNYGNKFNQVFFSSNRELSKKSTFKFFSNNVETCTVTAFDLKKLPNGTYLLTTTNKCFKGDSVNLIIDYELETQALNYAKKVEINVNLSLEIDKPIKATLFIDGNAFEIYGDVVQKAVNAPITKEQIKDCFSKSQFFVANIADFNLENCFISKGMLNDFRRKVFACAYEQLTKTYKRQTQIKTIKNNQGNVKVFSDFAFAFNAKEISHIEKKNIIYSPEFYQKTDLLNAKNLCQKLNKRLYLDTPNFALKKDVEILREIIKECQVPIVANNYYALDFDTEIIIGGGLNVYNSQTANCFNSQIIFAENTNYSVTPFPFMTLRHCPIKTHIGGDCTNCKYQDGYSYKMQNGKKLLLKRKKLSSCTFYLRDQN